MIDGYTTKEMKPTEMQAPKSSGMGKPAEMEDGIIFEKTGMYFFKWKGGECGYMTQDLAEAGLVKVSGNS
jgi:hypothetical protein|tara:strand:- start:330 stop:539 length:210 start_codon:yes stop_codon:yes gene_type:complete